MTRSSISRRTVLQTASGLLVAGSLAPAFATQKGTPEEIEKDLIFRSSKPRNGEPELAKLVNSWQTPTELFYVRSHAPNPVIDPKQFQLKVEGMVRRPATFSLDEIKQMPSVSTTATLTCAGNRRSEYNGPEYQNVPSVGGVQWEGGTIGNATWAGAMLSTILKQVEVTDGAKHIWFEGLDQIPKKGSVIGFGGSIPIEKAMLAEGPGTPLLTYTMNGAELTPDHGYPLRMVVPGYIGARSVKWLGKIVVSDRPSPNHYVATAYKIVKKTSPLDWSESGPIYRFPINAAICTPSAESTLAAGNVELAGYALPSGRNGSRIKDLLISADNGKTWTRGELTGKNQDFCWQLWKARVKVNAKTKELLLRAKDSAGDFMPARIPWNAKGYLRNSWYRLPVNVK
ncbi:molybdopterin-dependent oxidoreductase [Mariniblastus sp.]|nr:molybdopterin-dependent oxidoreductase [bacterium]MDA7880184.1 molybdopterin-dependent oxidoreductase [Mariniblastus sp.]MDA7909246.1 molybdopterin-dependent oxidoreductase [bacterium]MDB4357405.1 molybdopterin-dependent oxidoreductase [Mariniblastus sp.]MDB4372172.1 molybdopterin-dependent oxidoreductase [Mariniblastus sp.]